MKFFVFAVFMLVSTGVAVYKSPTFSLSGSPAKTETVTVDSHTISGNVIDDRLNDLNKKPLSKPAKKVSRVTLDSSRVIYLVSEVNFRSAQALANEVKQLAEYSKEPIWLLIDSPGGSVIDGQTLIAQMQASRAPVYTVCTRLCASMAAMIHSYGVKRYSTDGAILMYHPASGGAEGQIPNMISQMTTLNRYLEKMVSNVTGRSHLSKEEYDRLVPYEIWIDAEDSEARGLIDGIVNLSVPSFPAQNLAGLGDKLKTIPVVPVTPTKAPSTNLEYISPYPDYWVR